MSRGLSEIQREILNIAAALGTVQPRHITAAPVEQDESNRHPAQSLLPWPVRWRRTTGATVAIYRSCARLRDRGLLDGTGRTGYRLTDSGWTWLMHYDPQMFPAQLVAEVRALRQAEEAHAAAEAGVEQTGRTGARERAAS